MCDYSFLVCIPSWLIVHVLFVTPYSFSLSLLPSLSLSLFLCVFRVFRTMFQEGQAPSPSRRFTSPMIRKRLPTAGSIISPQGSRKLSHSGSKPKISANKRKKSVQDLTRSASPDPPTFFFCDDPRTMNIKEQVCGFVCIGVCV